MFVFLLLLFLKQLVEQFRCIKIQPKTIDISARLPGITTEFVGLIPQSVGLRSLVLGSTSKLVYCVNKTFHATRIWVYLKTDSYLAQTRATESLRRTV